MPLLPPCSSVSYLSVISRHIWELELQQLLQTTEQLSSLHCPNATGQEALQPQGEARESHNTLKHTPSPPAGFMPIPGLSTTGWEEAPEYGFLLREHGLSGSVGDLSVTL